MKLRKFIETFEEATLDEIVDDIFENNTFYYKEEISNYFDYELDSYNPNYIFSEKEKKQVIDACNKKFDSLEQEYIKKERDRLSNRKEIIGWIEGVISDRDLLDQGDVGFKLSAEEIADLIYKNYNN